MTIAELKLSLQEICRHHLVNRLQVFGSVSRGQETPASDIDFLVQFRDMPAREYAQHYFELLHGLEDTLGRPVDLITMASLKRATLKKSIQEESIVLYEA